MTIFVNNLVVPTFVFSGGECSVKINPESITPKTRLVAKLFNSNDIMNLLLTVDAIRRARSGTAIDLIIPYFPYARQDRVCNEGEALSVKVMADIINSMSCEQVTIYDPHSDVTPALINNCRVITLSEIINSHLKTFIHDNKLTLLSPDAGAEKKVLSVAKSLSTPSSPIRLVCASKIRDTVTGNITDTKIQDSVDSSNIIILDDICDGGRTFIELAKVLCSNGANNIYLYVTHGIFSKGLTELQQYFKHIYCYHTMLANENIDPSILTILSDNEMRG